MPALLVTWASGGTLVWILGEEGVSVFGWFWVKIVAVLAMTALHFRLGWHIRQFKSGANTFSMRYFRIINEVPALLAVVAVVMVVLKPF